MTEGFAYDGEMSEAIDATALDHLRAAFVAKLLKPSQVEQQGLRMVVQEGYQLIARLSPDVKLGLLRPQNTINGSSGGVDEIVLTFGWTKAQYDHRVSDQQNCLCAHGQRTGLEQYRIHFLSGNAKRAT